MHKENIPLRQTALIDYLLAGHNEGQDTAPALLNSIWNFSNIYDQSPRNLR